jgi:hypothetical protein
VKLIPGDAKNVLAIHRRTEGERKSRPNGR